MGTEVIKVDPENAYGDTVRRAVEVLDQGGVVAFPTETVYGVGARVDRPEAMGRLRALKSRPADKAFTVHIGSREDAFAFAPECPPLASRLMRKAWPGPLTLVVGLEDPGAAPASRSLNGVAMKAIYYNNAVGLRYPDDSVAEAVLRAVKAPMVAASANEAGLAPPLDAADVLENLDGRIDVLLDAGPTKYSKPSTIVRVTADGYEMIREGVYDAGIIERLSVLRILFVCTGNTCRSPMAEGIARKMLADKLGCHPDELPGRGVVVTSAGTGGGFGAASDNAVQVMSERGIDVTQHQSSGLTAEAIQQADHVFVMTTMHRNRVLDIVPAAEDRVRLLLDAEDVRDPVGGDRDEYERCAQIVEGGVRARLEEVMP
jgi:protein-tyrosine phosphatase